MEDKTAPESPRAESEAPTGPPWLRASLTDLNDLDFEAPVADSASADSAELGDLFRAAVDSLGQQAAAADTPASRVFGMLAAVMGMHFKPKEPNEPFGAMAVFADGRRSAIPADFRGSPVDVLAQMAERAKHPVLRARLADTCWLLDRKRGRLAGVAVAAYVEIVKLVDAGTLRFRFDKDYGALKYEARDLLRRALLIGRATGFDKAGASAARDTVAELRMRSLEKRVPIPALWFGHLDLDFSISEPAEVGKGVESRIGALLAGADPHTVVDLWRLAARSYHHAKNDEDKYRCQSAAAEQVVIMADQPSEMLASHMLSEAIAELHGVPGKKDRRKELRHRLIDVQAGISDEMSGFSYPTDLEELVKHVEQQMQLPSLRDQLFVFAALTRSPDPAQLADDAAKSIREHPLSSLFGASHHDREGKVIHRTDASATVRTTLRSSGKSRRMRASGATLRLQAKSKSRGGRLPAIITFRRTSSLGCSRTVLLCRGMSL